MDTLDTFRQTLWFFLRRLCCFVLFSSQVRVHVLSATRYGRYPPYVRRGAHQTPHHQAFRSGRHCDWLLRLNPLPTLNTPNTRTQERKRCHARLASSSRFRVRLGCGLSWPFDLSSLKEHSVRQSTFFFFFFKRSCRRTAPMLISRLFIYLFILFGFYFIF